MCGSLTRVRDEHEQVVNVAKIQRESFILQLSSVAKGRIGSDRNQPSDEFQKGSDL